MCDAAAAAAVDDDDMMELLQESGHSGGPPLAGGVPQDLRWRRLLQEHPQHPLPGQR